MASTQHQSPLFKLPRELRDEIYAYYTFEEDGYNMVDQIMGMYPSVDDVSRFAFWAIQKAPRCMISALTQLLLRAHIERFSAGSPVYGQFLATRSFSQWKDSYSIRVVPTAQDYTTTYSGTSRRLPFSSMPSVALSQKSAETSGGFYEQPGPVFTGSSVLRRKHPTWIESGSRSHMIRIAMLPSRGMPQTSFKVLLGVRSDDAIQLWTVIEQTAAARDVLDGTFSDQEVLARSDYRILMYMTAYVWLFPKVFSTAVKDIMADTSIITIDGPCSEPWTWEEATSKYQNQSNAHWGHVYHRMDLRINIIGGEIAYWKKYCLSTPPAHLIGPRSTLKLSLDAVDRRRDKSRP
ncbi:hypothetical protein CC86DRAFT_451647 [Ophiobolus disseminans]|uniref:Uncharacterized protein n=1 Tax=Ophiobolus disseminans TaxID=1469910 RepID=A0A6A7AGY9_9PLEO|nr:hypothetical protein CC86DRAFT_451647 [Ophiobolus disseminans]